MLASTRADVAELNEMARYGLIANGHVAPTGLDIDGQTFAVGDRVMILKPDRRLRLINGERGDITAITDHDITASTTATNRRASRPAISRTAAWTTPMP